MVMLGSTYGFPGAGWCIISVFFVLMVRPKLSQAIENLSRPFCMFDLVVAFSAQKHIDDISLHLVLCLKPSEVEDRAVRAVSNVNSIIWATQCMKQHRRKHDTEKSRGQDTSLHNPICDEKGYGAFSVVLHPCMRTVMKLSNDGDEFFGAVVFCHDSPKAVPADNFKCLGQINISRVEVSILFLTLLLHLSYSKHHTNSPTFLTKAALTLR